MRLLLLALLWPIVLAAQPLSSGGHTISVTGDAEIKVVPDRVLVVVGVETRHQALAEARRQNDVLARAVIAAAATLRIDPSNVQTDFIQVHIRYDTTNRAVVSYYEVEKAISVTLEDISRFEDFLNAALDAGANHIYRVSFYTTELRKHRDQARALAVKAAIEKANDMAAAAGLRVAGKPLGISSYSYGGGSWYGRYGDHGIPTAQNVYLAGPSGANEGTVALGRISVTATVTMSFLLD
jgi:hypothetical protein